MTPHLKAQQQQILKHLSSQIDDFYLAGGTALSLFYFDHRESIDLDFFTPEFSSLRVEKVIHFLTESSGLSINLEAQNLNEKNQLKVMIYYVRFENNSVKSDTVSVRTIC